MVAANKFVFIAIVATCIVFVAGFLIGYFARDTKSSQEEKKQEEKKQQESQTESGRFEVHNVLYTSLKADKLREYLRKFTDRPHVAGSDIQLEYGEKIVKEWESYKTFDKVETFPYNVLLSYLEAGETNIVQLLNSSGNIVKEFKGKEKVLEASENDTAVIPPILGYAKPGNASGKLLYANYGRKEDFEKLKEISGTNCSGYIVIMRYGKIYRGNKINLAAKCGAVGAILYNDPEDSAPLGEDKTYPNTWWLPPTGVQRGNLRLVKGDPLTPLVPAVDGIFRMKTDEVNMPQIPATPLPYGQAKQLLEQIKGKEAPDDWQGGFNLTYGLGINYTGPNVTIQVNAKLRNRNITNIVGTITGKEEPDRWILLGAHRDAWGFGAVDSSCGTAIIMEIARGLRELVKSGWRPRRTIMLCSWGAEEQGLIGSTEWVEQRSKIVRERAVAYINVDAVVRGNYSLKVSSSPLLKQLMFDQSKLVHDPRDDSRQNNKSLSLYQRWSKTSKGSGKPTIGALGSGSDFVPFYQFLGVPSLAFHYSFNDHNVTTYPVYHSIHDTFNWMEKFVDPKFLIHLSMCKLTSRLLLHLSDKDILPMDVTKYSDSLISSMNKLNDSAISGNPDQLSFDYIRQAIREFNKTAHEFNKRKNFSSKESSRLRVLNNQMANLEKIFINPHGLPGRPEIRNIVFAPSTVNSYGSSAFPGINDELSEKPINWQEVKKQINILYKSIREAKDFLEPLQKED